MTDLGLVVAEFEEHAAVIDEMERAAVDAAADHGARVVETVRVPGTYDTPLAADRLARRENVDAVVVVGCVVSGDTDHDRVIATAAAQGLTDVSLDRDTPVMLGITGPGMSAAEARERTDAGAKAVAGAVERVEAAA
jgi:6,7-dimethyl-8-ribityllumazine synthase